MADGSAPKPYPDADVDLVAEEIAESFNANNRACTIPADFASEARAVLDALAEAGRLLPPGWTTAAVDEQFRKLRGDLDRSSKPTSGYTGLTGTIWVTGTHLGGSDG